MKKESQQPKMYVLNRKDLSPSYRAVQGAHAVAEYLTKTSNPLQWIDGIIVFLKVNDEYELLKWAQKLDKQNISFSAFNEPDLDYELTSICTVTNDDKIFKGVPLN